ACTTAGTSTCHTGSCTGGTAIPGIDDGNACTQDLCNTGTGQITHPPTNEGGICDDGNACTTAGTSTCHTGSCSGGTAIPGIDDGNTCTQDLCNTSTGQITHPPTNEGATCDDGTLCTAGDACHQGTCAGTPVVCHPSDQCH